MCLPQSDPIAIERNPNGRPPRAVVCGCSAKEWRRGKIAHCAILDAKKGLWNEETREQTNSIFQPSFVRNFQILIRPARRHRQDSTASAYALAALSSFFDFAVSLSRARCCFLRFHFVFRRCFSSDGVFGSIQVGNHLGRLLDRHCLALFLLRWVPSRHGRVDGFLVLRFELFQPHGGDRLQSFLPEFLVVPLLGEFLHRPEFGLGVIGGRDGDLVFLVFFLRVVHQEGG